MRSNTPDRTITITSYNFVSDFYYYSCDSESCIYDFLVESTVFAQKIGLAHLNAQSLCSSHGGQVQTLPEGDHVCLHVGCDLNPSLSPSEKQTSFIIDGFICNLCRNKISFIRDSLTTPESPARNIKQLKLAKIRLFDCRSAVLGRDVSTRPAQTMRKCLRILG